MNLVIHKYYLTANTDNQITLPKDAQLLNVHVQHDGLYLWALHDILPKEYETRVIGVYGTGIEIRDHDKLKFLNTCLSDNGNFVWHAFERINFWSL